MKRLLLFYRTTVGKKIVMALSGLIMVLFVLGHMVGNMKMFFGFDAARNMYFIDHYGQLLREIGEDFVGHRTFLWMVRFVLLGSVLVHVVSSLELWWLNRKARPQAYAKGLDYQSATFSSLTMIYGGLFLALFIIFHIMHFTTGQVHTYGFEEGRIYANVHHAFTHGSLVAMYVISMLFLALHLYHGGWSLFQTLGIDTPAINRGIRMGAAVIAIVLFAGFSAVPVGVYFGALPTPRLSAPIQQPI